MDEIIIIGSGVTLILALMLLNEENKYKIVGHVV